uniref:Uncharacterized protein n=1 Tax=Chromera velia CCMP2878 TaxID=1169474 RepID=A0A0G4HGL2_9ALVE|eukprot:Cvel_27368.t1-p1 / transcript=Cvel_27368.t1 / gene=Cvel_27368 / organism=Chromera_velia_CCMP2878 / gene_product=hypothetical protein / transcript_product=hypothetical protein / location=Cvel_scaffold3403:2697-3005(-) / protein_length=103 / sequence_SO=supercontig / SO=protein_coding / is_pseudo=false
MDEDSVYLPGGKIEKERHRGSSHKAHQRYRDQLGRALDQMMTEVVMSASFAESEWARERVHSEIGCLQLDGPHSEGQKQVEREMHDFELFQQEGPHSQGAKGG